MTWLKSDDKFPRNPKVWDLSDAAYRLYDASRHYCAEQLSDGHVPASRVTSLTPRPPRASQIDELLRARLWHRTADTCAECLRLREDLDVGPLPHGGFMVHDFLVYNPTRARVMESRARKQRAGQAGGQASAQARSQANASAPTQARTRTRPVPESLKRLGTHGEGISDPRVREVLERTHLGRIS